MLLFAVVFVNDDRVDASEEEGGRGGRNLNCFGLGRPTPTLLDETDGSSDAVVLAPSLLL